MAAREEPVEPGGRAFEGPGSLVVDGTRIASTAARTIGELLLTAGLVVLLFVVYELYVTDFFAARQQAEASYNLDEQWAGDRQSRSEPPGEAEAFARLYIPSFGADYRFTIQEGVGESSLRVGPGHYPGTAQPGELGNFGVAGHRVGRGAPFNDLDQLSSCDPLVVETQAAFFLYRVLPHDGEINGWAGGKGKELRCAGVFALRGTTAAGDGPYGATVGRKVVSPNRGDAVSPVPYQPVDLLPAVSRVALLTLTTCHPRFSARERLIVHSILVKQWRKTHGLTYQDLLREIGGTR